MKRLIIAFVLLLSQSLETNAMPFRQEPNENAMKPPLVPPKPPKRIPFFMITIHSDPRIEFIKFPTENCISLNKGLYSYVNAQAGSSFNGVKILEDLSLTPALDNRLFFSNIIDAFGNVQYQCSMGHMSRKLFQKIYPFFPRNW
jgi:hypothetical protein